LLRPPRPPALIILNPAFRTFPPIGDGPRVAAMNDATGLLTARRYRSGAIDIDPVQRQVVIDGEPTRLGSRAFELLMTLLRQRAAEFHEAQVAAIAFDGAPLDGLPSATSASILDEPDRNTRGSAA
jgi:hypothetical protein